MQLIKITNLSRNPIKQETLVTNQSPRLNEEKNHQILINFTQEQVRRRTTEEKQVFRSVLLPGDGGGRDAGGGGRGLFVLLIKNVIEGCSPLLCGEGGISGQPFMGPEKDPLDGHVEKVLSCCAHQNLLV
ncbi:hypothetical protein CEXT_377061 [Caerostris extrusa]|uniref:Uncharacterized protein n=1 Tax=Caerostris extrusa TaxID=172846 RepID=A0AAV4W1Y3_CAEEX|nr:hypothetical protein CEXT_377061 [Caerostris extrusa]